MTPAASRLPVKYRRARTSQRPGVTIWLPPGAGLHRVLEISAGEFTVEILMPTGWTTVLALEPGEAETPADALQLWLDIQAPPDDAEDQSVA